MTNNSVKAYQIDWDKAGRHPAFLRVAVLGAGTMGSQIAAHFANAGVSVLLLDIAPKEGSNSNAIVQSGFKRMRALKPNPLFSSEAAARITLGNFDDDFDRLADVDWVIEAVVERRDVKESIMARLEQVTTDSTVISSNTSGIPIADLGINRSDSFKSRLLGTHFFNPPRYLSLLELIPTPDTNRKVVERVASFGRIHLGKGVVVAKDSPYFIGNRIGIYAMLISMKEHLDGDYSIEEVDALSGTLVGRPKSATFRTADVVGLDVMKAVIENLREAVPHDESREVFKSPVVLDTLLEAGSLGAKTKSGFYKKEGREILSYNLASGAYEQAVEVNLPEMAAIQAAGGLKKRMNALFESDSRSGDFFRRTILETLSYAARRLPEISDSPADIDNAIRWGFGWRLGPFETWDVLGFDRVHQAMNEASIELPAWIDDMISQGRTRFYEQRGTGTDVYLPASGGSTSVLVPNDERPLIDYRRQPKGIIWENESASLLDMGDEVALLEFRSKANSMGAEVIAAIQESVSRIETDRNFRGMVIGNEGTNFSVGANLGELAMTLLQGDLAAVEQAVLQFQKAIQRVRYAAKPVVVAAHQRVLGGACELVMAATQTVAAAESYIGLVELGVGLIPAGTGSTRIASGASEAAPNGHESEILAVLARYFENVAMANVSTSAREAQEMGFLSNGSLVAMRAERRFEMAKREVLRLASSGYLPPVQNLQFTVLGTPGAAALNVMAYQYHQGRYISDYDFMLAKKLAQALTGGDLPGATLVDESYMLNLERQIFMTLLGEQKTQDRIRHILEHNKPLRN